MFCIDVINFLTFLLEYTVWGVIFLLIAKIGKWIDYVY